MFNVSTVSLFALVILSVSICITAIQRQHDPPLSVSMETESLQERKYYELVDTIARDLSKKLGASSSPNSLPITSDVMRGAKYVEGQLKKDGISIRRIISHSFEGESNLIVTLLLHKKVSEDTFAKRFYLSYQKSNNRIQFQLIKSESIDESECIQPFVKLPTNESGYGQIDLLLNMFKDVKCSRDSHGLCKRGTVEVDKWMVDSLALQRKLGYDLPLNEYQFFGTHNSFNDRPDGYGEYNTDLLINKIMHMLFGNSVTFIWAQQEYTMTDQLNMGIRALHLDPHWFFDDVRLCHSGLQISVVDDIVALYEKIFGKIDFDSQNLFCSPWDRPWKDGLSEIREWMNRPENSKEFIFIHHDDQSSWTLNKTKEVVDPIIQIFGDILLTPPEKQKLFPDRWPSVNELLALGKRILFQSEDDYGTHGGAAIFSPFLVPHWDIDCVKFFSPYPTCGDYNPGDWFTFGSESQILGPFYDGSKACGLVVPYNLGLMTACGTNVIGMDQVSPPLMEAAVWSWEKNEPSIKGNSSSHCTVINPSGRWSTLPCDEGMFMHACMNKLNHYDWLLSGDRGKWGDAKCPTGYHYSVPANAAQNRILMTLLGSKDPIWLNLKV